MYLCQTSAHTVHLLVLIFVVSMPVPDDGFMDIPKHVAQALTNEIDRLKIFL